jgi:pimeloyl-ACP methyl ester carboxylesterase
MQARFLREIVVFQKSDFLGQTLNNILIFYMSLQTLLQTFTFSLKILSHPMNKTRKRVFLILATVVLLVAVLCWGGWRNLTRVLGARSPIIDDPKIEAVAGSGFAGHWEGTLNVMGMQELRIQLHVKKVGDGKLTGTFISPDQSEKALTLTTCEETAGDAAFAIKSINGSFKGGFNTDGSRLTGHWKQKGMSFPLLLKRQSGPPKPPARPQTPQPPFPYEIHEVTIENTAAGVTLAGTLTIPFTDSRGVPAVILLTGSGPQDRDETIAGHKPFHVLADHLTRQGIAILRYDDRGAAKSTGDFSQATSGDFAADAAAAFAFLKTRAGIAPARIGLCGHSSGATEAFLVAAENPDVAFVVSLAGAGVRMDALLERQRADIARASGIKKIPEKTETMNRALVALAREKGDTPETRAEAEKLLKKAGVPAGQIKGHLSQIFSPWMIAILRHDPRPTLARVKCPVLALNGDKDTQVAADANLPALRTGLEAGGNTGITTRTLPGLNHLFQKCMTGAPAEYGKIEETFNPDALATITDWIIAHTR